ncbi:MAG: DUF6894 family protein [Pseudorhizobium sp.]
MPRYFFHLAAKAGTVLDLEGAELPDLAHALREAVEDARHLMSDAVRSGRDISARQIEICDAAGVILSILPFTDALSHDD